MRGDLNRENGGGLDELLAKAGSIRILTVTEINNRIRDVIEENFSSVWVAGEVSNLRVPSSGHCYFTLKDERSQISAIIWRSQAARLRFDIKDGMSVVIQGELDVYPPMGRYQVICRQVYPKGVGELDLAFRRLKEKLAKEGLFDLERKRPLPFLPRRIGIVTSATGAAIRDMLKTIEERCPFIPILVRPARVQGEGAAEDIALAIKELNSVEDIDVIIVGRGGGSIEDLWAFNEEIVARAIFNSSAPVVSAVGHQTDFTISDFVADARALTPTDAGRLVAPDRNQLIEQIRSMSTRLARGLAGRLERARDSLDSLARSYVFRRPMDMIRLREQRLDDLAVELQRAGREHVADRLNRLENIAARLEALSPKGVLARGYSITIRANDGKIVRGASDVAPGESVKTILGRGSLRSTVDSVSGDEE